MAIEFLLLALLDGQEPLILKKYDHLGECQGDAWEASTFVSNNYLSGFDILTTPEIGTWVLIRDIANFNSRYKRNTIPIPSLQETEGLVNRWLARLISAAEDVNLTALEEGQVRMAEDSSFISKSARDLNEYWEQKASPRKELPNFTLSSLEVKYTCLAAPK